MVSWNTDSLRTLSVKNNNIKSHPKTTVFFYKRLHIEILWIWNKLYIFWRDRDRRTQFIGRTLSFRKNISVKSEKLQKQPPECSIKKGVLKNFEKFTGKHLCQSLFFKKSFRSQPATLLKKTLWHKCFPVNIPKFLRTSFFQNTSGWIRCCRGIASVYLTIW